MHHSALARGMPPYTKSLPPDTSEPTSIGHTKLGDSNTNTNKRPLTPKSMPPTGDEQAQLKA